MLFVEVIALKDVMQKGFGAIGILKARTDRRRGHAMVLRSLGSQPYHPRVSALSTVLGYLVVLLFAVAVC